jgi:hypothetical protein
MRASGVIVGTLSRAARDYERKFRTPAKLSHGDMVSADHRSYPARLPFIQFSSESFYSGHSADFQEKFGIYHQPCSGHHTNRMLP